MQMQILLAVLTRLDPRLEFTWPFKVIKLRSPIAGISKRQTNVSHSTPEAEIVAADFAVRSLGTPALTLWSLLLRKEVYLQFHEDFKSFG